MIRCRSRSRLVILCGITMAMVILQTNATDLNKCPIGYKLGINSQSNTELCFQQKASEYQDQIFNGCAGNFFAKEILKITNVTLNEGKYWAEYVSAYEEGPLVDMSYGPDSGKPLYMEYELPDGKKEFCTIFDASSKNLSIVDCSEKYPRYCFINTYGDTSDDDLCEKPYKTFKSPIPACVRTIRAQNASGKETELQPKATWLRASKSCRERNATLLQKAWIYANNKELRPPDEVNTKIPLGIVLTDGHLYWNKTIIPQSEWNFFDNEGVGMNLSSKAENVSIALSRDHWMTVPENELFYQILCEQPLELKSVSLTLYLLKGRRIGLRLSESLKKHQIKCFTDSETYYPIPVDISDKEDNIIYELKPILNGYYWCINNDTINFKPSSSNKLLYVKHKENLKNEYAIRIEIADKISLADVSDIEKSVHKKLNEYFHLRSSFQESSILTNTEVEITEDNIKAFSKRNKNFKNVINSLIIRRVFPKLNSVLVHVNVREGIEPNYINETWSGLRITQVRPLYFCQEFGNVSRKGLGQVDKINCTRFTCTTHDFNEGVFWIESQDDEDCESVKQLSATLTIKEKRDDRFDESIESSELPQRTTEMPKIYTRPPETVSTQNITITPALVITTEMSSTSLTPSDILENIIDNLETAINNEDVEINSEFLTRTAYDINELLSTENDVDIPGRLLSLIVRACSEATLGDATNMTVVTENIALVIADSSLDNRVNGLVIHSDSEDDVQILTGASTAAVTNETELRVDLTSIHFDDDERVTFVVFKDDKAFTLDENATPVEVNSRVISITIGNVTSFPEGQYIDIQLQPLIPEVDEDSERACAYWNYDGERFGEWSTDGCQLMTIDGSSFCRCNHLTHFAEIILPLSNFSDTHEFILGILSLLGVILSLIGLMLIALTGILFHSWRKDFANKIWLSLSCSIFALDFIFLLIYFIDNQYIIACSVLGVLLHYSMLSSFCWMVVAAALSYKRLVLVFTKYSSHKLLKASAFAWGLPMLIIGILFLVDSTAYSNSFGENIRSFCYPEGLQFYLTVFLPIIVAVIINAVFFVIIVKAVFASRRIKRYGDSNEALRFISVSFLLVFLFGLPWVFGLFSYILVFAYLFVITATLQGFILFCFFIVGNKKTRDLWLNLLHIKRKGKIPVTTSSYRSGHLAGTQSSNVMNHGNGSTTDSTPRSLVAKDDSRFS